MSNVVVDCILPNTVIVPISCSNAIQLKALKETLWKETKKYPKLKALASRESYIFVGVTDDCKQTEFYDESEILSELRLASPILKVIKVQQTAEEKAFQDDMKIIFGQSIPQLQDGEETLSFRAVLLQIIYSAMHQRNKRGYKSLAYYKYPPILDPTPYLDPKVNLLLSDEKLTVTVWCLNGKSYAVRVPWDAFPERIVEEVLQSWQSYQSKDLRRACAEFSLKIRGCEEYLLEKCPLVQYKTIRTLISDSKEPHLSLIPTKKFYSELLTYQSTLPPNPAVKRKEPPQQETSLWHPSMEGRLKIHVKSVKRLQQKFKSVIRAALYHGDERLSGFVETRASVHSWDEWLQLDIPIQELPRASKLCFSLCHNRKLDDRKRRKTEDEFVLQSYGCFYLFDFKGRLAHGNVNIAFQEALPNVEQLMQPLAVYDQPPQKDCLQLTIGFEERFEKLIIFPDGEQSASYGHYVMKLEKKSKRALIDEEIVSIRTLITKNPISELTAEDKEFFWRARQHCSKFSDCLPHLVRSVNWGSRDCVSQFYILLEEFPAVSLPVALELLQSSFADNRVRNHAVASIYQSTPDEKLSQFLLQLTFALRHEAYLDSPLLRFLLRKCLCNKNLAQSFFWHLRSQSLSWPGCKRMAAVLVAFCRGLGADLVEFVSRVKVIDKIAELADVMNDSKIDSSKDTSKFLQDLLLEDSFSSALQDIMSPLEPSIHLGKLRASECKVIDSARRPLLLVWENADPMADALSISHGLIFKGRDDLRQDMLTLQIIGIMSQVWIEEGLNLCMTPYSCLVTGNKTGLIEVVQNASTVYSIQKRAKLGALQVDSSQLLKWIKDRNADTKFRRAVDTFTRSCAGYCVATFVLGIGDRHPDNIMIHENGQIFHIDFGHFLGNFKKKFGFQRERVPFVLTEDFLKVICAETENPKDSMPFQQFQELCGKAYLILRKHTRFLVTLFTLLLSAGIPELQSAKDISYLKTTLAVGMSEEKAIEYFQNRFSEAYGGSWSTKVDWFFHSVKHR